MKKLIFCLAFTKIPENQKLMSSAALRNACLYINTLLYEKAKKNAISL